MCRIPLVMYLCVAMLVLAIVPAALVWVIVFVGMNQSTNLLRVAGTDSLTDLATSLQSILISKSLQSLAAQFTDAATALDAQAVLLQAKGFQDQYLSINETGSYWPLVTEVSQSLFATMRSHPLFSLMAVRGFECPPGSTTGCTRTFWYGFQASYVSPFTLDPRRTIYGSYWTLAANRTVQTNLIYYPNQTTGQYELTVTSLSQGPMFFTMRDQPEWQTDITFSPVSGQSEIYRFVQTLPAQTNTWVDVFLALNCYTVSDELRKETDASPLDRLFVLFRQTHGHLLGASHGKFYSNSDVDTRKVNMLKNPVDPKTFRPYTCLNSTDFIIYEACEQLYALANESWLNLPLGTRDMQLNGSEYWVAVGESPFQPDCYVVHLKHRATIMGVVEGRGAEVDALLSQKETLTYVVVGVATGIAALCPLLIIWLVQRRLKVLGAGFADKRSTPYYLTAL